MDNLERKFTKYMNRRIKLTSLLLIGVMMANLMTGCNNADNVVQDTQKANTSPEEKQERSEYDKYDEIYLLNNEIPCGLLLKNINQEDVILLLGEPNEYSKWHSYPEKENLPQLVYSGYRLYGYDTSIEMNFDKNNILTEIYVNSEVEMGVVAFTRDDIERIAAEIEQCLNVEPKIGTHEGIQYTFVSDGLIYRMDTYQSRVSRKTQNSFNLLISKEKDDSLDSSTVEVGEPGSQNKLDENEIYSSCSDFINNYPKDILDYVSSSENATVSFNISRAHDNLYYENYKEVMEDVAKLLGAEEKDGSYLYKHARNSVGGSSAYFSWRFLVDNKEYLVYVQDIDSKDYWIVGIEKYEAHE